MALSTKGPDIKIVSFQKKKTENNGKEISFKKCSPNLVIMEMQIKTTWRFHITPIKTAKTNGTTHNRDWRGIGEKGILSSSLTIYRTANCCDLCENICG